MIALLRGILEEAGSDWVILDVNGVGYLVFASNRTLSRLPVKGQQVRLLIETHVREDHIHLYGFQDQAERDWFRLLTTVQGVGAKVGLAILSTLSPDDLIQAIVAQDKKMLTRANGVGPKVATRILTELKDKVASLDMTVSTGAVSSEGSAPTETAQGFGGPVMEAVSALTNLGYGRSEAMAAVSLIYKKHDGQAPLDQLIREALSELAVM